VKDSRCSEEHPTALDNKTMRNIKYLSELYHFSKDVISHLIPLYGDEVESCLWVLKRPSSRYSVRINTIKIDPNEFVSALEEKGVEVERHPEIPEALFMKVEGPFAIPETEKKVVADKFSAESVLQGAHLYAPGIIKCTGLRRGNTVTIVDEEDQVVGVGKVEMGETEVLTYRQGLAVRVTYPRYRAPSVLEAEEFKRGLIYNQSFPAIVASRVLAPQPGETILDMCAAPGGKTGHIAQLMQNKGRIIAVDRNAEKVKKLNETLARLRVENVRFLCHDARYLDVDLPSLKPDRVLVDPPCSSIGVRPSLFDYTTSEEISALARYQRQFLMVASRIVKPKGIVVYCTCTLTVEENEKVVESVIEKTKLEIVEQAFFYGSLGSLEILPEARLMQRFYPDQHDCPGFFIAKLRKT